MGNKDLLHSLEKVLADTYSIYLKSQNFHWNYEGPNFKPVHEMLEEQYSDIANAIDVIAELIRGLGHKSPGSFEEFSKLTSIKSASIDTKSSDMLKIILSDHEHIQSTLTEALKVANNEEDEVIAGYLIERITFHRKAAWFVRSSI